MPLNCSNCKHWQYDHLDGSYGLCRRIGLRVSGDSDRDLDEDNVDLGQLPAFTKDGSDYKADLHTLPTFSCNLHKAKIDV